MNPLLLRLLLFACVGLAGLGFSSLLVLRLDRSNARRRQRIAAATTPYLPSGEAEMVNLFRRTRATRSGALKRKAALLIGFDPNRRDVYPLPWWVVLGAALAVSRGAAGIMGGLLGPLSLALVPVGTVFLCRSFFGWCDGRRTRLLFHQMPDALAMIVRSVRVGIPMHEAMQVVAREGADPTAEEFRLLGNRIMLGMPLDEALRDMADRNGLAEYRFFATALSLQSQTGGGLTETLENLAEVIRKRVALRARGYALASEARTSAGILAALPVVTGIALWFLNRAYTSQLFTDPTGRKIFGTAVLSLVIGLLVMRSIIQRSLT
ncbi:MAG: type II secretion system F family protein [Rhodospirillales bacterium]|nr:type II secretion system F family protein [Rhodospirillales bacterium]